MAQLVADIDFRDAYDRIQQNVSAAKGVDPSKIVRQDGLANAAVEGTTGNLPAELQAGDQTEAIESILASGEDAGGGTSIIVSENSTVANSQAAFEIPAVSQGKSLEHLDVDRKGVHIQA